MRCVDDGVADTRAAGSMLWIYPGVGTPILGHGREVQR